MTFAHPWLLLLLLLLPLAAWLKGRRGPSSAFLYSSVKLAEGLTSATRSRVGTFLAAVGASAFNQALEARRDYS